MLHGIPCIQSGTFGPHCVNPLHSIGIHCTMLHGIYGIQLGYIRHTAWNQLHSITLHGFHFIHSGCISQRCIGSSAFNHAAWNPLHSIGIHWATLQGIHCIHSGCIAHCFIESTALNLDAWNPLLNWYQLHNSAGNPLHSIGICCSMLHGFHCMQPGYIAPRCMQSTAFTLDVFHNAACNPLHSLWMYFTTLHGIQCIQSFRM